MKNFKFLVFDSPIIFFFTEDQFYSVVPSNNLQIQEKKNYGLSKAENFAVFLQMHKARARKERVFLL